MKTKYIVWILIGFILFVGGCSTMGKYNSMVEKDQAVKSAWSQVENVYQRRADLIPNLVNTVKGVANFEKSTLTAVIEARAKATQITIDPSKSTPAQLKQFSDAQDGLSSTLSRLMVTVEKYPELKANQNFVQLQSQLEGTENRIAVERRRFNEKAQEYNTYIRKFPNNIFAGCFSFSERSYFEASKGADKAPDVKF